MPKKPRGKGYFAVALDMAIAESGLTMDEIERRCEEIGRPVSSVYIGRLRRGLMPPPSNEVSESIALALGIDPDVLLMVGQLERTPDKVQELFIITVRRAAGLLALTEFVLKLDHRAGKFLMNLPEADREHGWRDYWLLKEAIAGGMLDAARDLRDFVFKLQEWLPEEYHGSRPVRLPNVRRGPSRKRCHGFRQGLETRQSAMFRPRGIAFRLADCQHPENMLHYPW